MSDPDCCPRCGTFWRYHDESQCGDEVHRTNERLTEENAALQRDNAKLREALAGLLANFPSLDTLRALTPVSGSRRYASEPVNQERLERAYAALTPSAAPREGEAR